MQAELSAPDNVGDVLASIRRMIALEGVEGAAPLILSQSQQIAPEESGAEPQADGGAEPQADEAVLSVEEEAEFAEAEAALARMLSPARQPEPEQAIGDAGPEAGDEAGVDEGLNLFLETGRATDADLHSRVRDALRQELEGEMGASFSRNLQTLIRREVEAAIRGLSAGH